MPKDLLYTKTHEWTKIEGPEATLGITHFAQEQLGDLTYVELPEVGRTVAAGEEIGSVESVKAASELYSPISGEVVAVNNELASAPEKVNQDPYGQGWMARVKLFEKPKGLLSPDEYERITA
ncbi:MAG: glycine cleavage system protein GcvH [Thermodesulfobacteriota bacterium]|nr:glycine cleavage system protein GcvH [Thermodesulfobacteriota bacterium]